MTIKAVPLTAGRRFTMAEYRIRVKGRIDRSWADWFDKTAMTYRGAETWIQRSDLDQSALHGMLNKIRDLNMTLISVERIESQGGPS
jgi:hypothetical protein